MKLAKNDKITEKDTIQLSGKKVGRIKYFEGKIHFKQNFTYWLDLKDLEKMIFMLKEKNNKKILKIKS